MPFKVLADGSILCDTAREAVELSQMMRGAAPAQERARESNSGQNGKSDSKLPAYQNFWDDLEDRGKRVLRVLAAKHESYVRGEDLARALEIDTAKLPGPMVHVRSIADRHGIGEPVHRKKYLEGTRMRSSYQINKKLLEALKDEVNST